jgi:hypothetical protein
MGEASMYDKGWWLLLVRVWEAVVFNPLMDLERVGLPLAVVAALGTLTRRWWRPRLAACWRRRKLRGSTAHKQRAATGLDRDLDV